MEPSLRTFSLSTPRTFNGPPCGTRLLGKNLSSSSATFQYLQSPLKISKYVWNVPKSPEPSKAQLERNLHEQRLLTAVREKEFIVIEFIHIPDLPPGHSHVSLAWRTSTSQDQTSSRQREGHESNIGKAKRQLILAPAQAKLRPLPSVQASIWEIWVKIHTLP